MSILRTAFINVIGVDKSLRAIWARIVTLAIFGAIPALAATYTVTSTADTGTGCGANIVVAGCTLRVALEQATSGNDTIQFSLGAGAHTITLTSDELHLNANVTITGPGASLLTISGGNSFRIFENDYSTVSISGVTITKGNGISVQGNNPSCPFNAVNCFNAEGGAIWNQGTLTLTNCIVSGNSVTTSALTPEGGAIFNYGTLTLSGTTVSGNTATGNSTLNPYDANTTIGGGIFNSGDGGFTAGVLNVINGSIISGNSSGQEGGGIYSEGTLTITNSTVSGNSSYQGAGVQNDATATITGSTISGNTGLGFGGGIDNNATLTITNSTFSGNSATGGGGISNGGTTLNASFVTLSGNSASYAGGNLYNSGTAVVKNSILANGTGGNCNTGGTLTSQNYNLSDDASCTTFNQSNDINGVSAQLNAAGLASNGGLTKTIAPLGSSPAIDVIPVSSCVDTNGNAVTTDQRGTARPQGPQCDIGAVELAWGTTAQTITFNALTSQPGGTSFVVSASSSSGLAVSFNSQTPAICSVSGTNGTTVTLGGAAGTCTIQATQLGNTTYAAATPVNQSFQVTAAVTLTGQTITFGMLANQPINAAAFAVSATASSTLTVSFNSQTAAVCSATGAHGATITVLAIGTCTIQATQAGNATYAAAAPVSQSFQVTLAAQTITFGPLINRPLTTLTFPLTATASSGLTVTFSSTTSSVCTISGVTVSLLGAGLCSIQAAQPGNAIYAAATPVTQSFNVALTPLSYGSASRVTQQDQYPGDFEDITVNSSFVLYTSVSIEGAYPKLVPITPANLAGLSVGVWSDTASAYGSARTLAFRNFINQTTAPITLQLNAVLNGMFEPSPFGLPNALAYIAAGIHVIDGPVFNNVIAAAAASNPSLTPAQVLLDGYTLATSLNPASAIGKLDALFPGGVLAAAIVFSQDNSPNPSATISANVNSQVFTVQPQQIVTVIFDAASSALTTTLGGQIGGGDAYFLDTLAPAANFFTDANGNPIPGLTAVDVIPSTTLSPTPGNLTLAPATGSNIAGTTATVTATATDTNGNPLSNAVVTFKVASGPNAGMTGGGTTGANGEVAFGYTGTGGTGTDTIEASIGTLASNVVTETWTSAPLPSGSACNGTYNGTFNGNLTIVKGQNCILVGGTVTGNINQTGGSLSIANFRVTGNVQVQGASTFLAGPNAVIDGNLAIQNVPAAAAQTQVCRSTVKGNVQVQDNGAVVEIGSASASCAGNTIGGNLSVQNNTGATMIVGNTVANNLQDQNNTAPTQVFSNTVTNNLQCQNNSSITGGGNTTTNGQKFGQCSAF